MSSVKFKYPKEATLVPLSEINLDNRARTEFGDLQDTADSILEVGLIHPPTLREDKTLVAGERRIRAMQLLGAEEIPCVFREQMSDVEVREAELHENVKRLNMQWQERVLLIHDAHRLREHENALEGRPWYQKETGELFGKSAAHVSNCIELAKYLLNNDEEVLKCATITDAVKLLVDRAERAAMDEQVRRHGVQVPATPTKRKETTVITNIESGEEEIKETSPIAAPPMVQPEVEFDLGKMFYLGDSIEVMKSLHPGSVDHVITDIPYGIDVDQMDIMGKEEIADTHQIEQNIEMMPLFLEQAWRLIGTKGGFCIFFYDLTHHEKLIKWAEDLGFKVTQWPFHWIKTHPCQCKAPQFNPTKSIEYAMICRRGTETTLIKPWKKNYVMADGLVERRMYSNPFAKPAKVWNEIFDYTTIVGQTILDPYVGQGSSVRAMLNRGLKPVGIDISEYHFVRCVQGAIEQIQQMTNNKARFINNPLNKFNG